MTLPAIVSPKPGQALDSYLEAVADANLLTPAQLLRLARSRGSKTRFLTLIPDDKTITTLAGLTGASADQLRAMTISGLAGHEPWDLTGFDPEAHNSFATIGNRGWLRTRGSQLCPSCLSQTNA